HAADDEAGREARRPRGRLLHDEPRRSRTAIREAEADARAGRRAVGRVPEAKLEAGDGPQLRRRPADRSRRRARRQQEHRLRRRLVRGSLRLPQEGPSLMWPELRERLEGRVIVLEPIDAKHEPAMRTAAADPVVWRWMQIDASTGAGVDQWFGHARRKA